MTLRYASRDCIRPQLQTQRAFLGWGVHLIVTVTEKDSSEAISSTNTVWILRR